MVTILPHTTRASGTLLTATIYNTDHQVHVTNATTINADAAFKNVANAWTVGQTFNVGIVVSDTNTLSRNVDNSVVNIWGGTWGFGANVELYGGTHATNANQAYIDASAIFMRGVGGTGTPTVTIGGNTVLHTGNDETLANAALLGGQNAAFFRNSSNQDAGTLLDARLPGTMTGKTFSGSITIDAGNGTSSTAVGSGSIEIFRTLGGFIDWKDQAGDDFDVRLLHTGFNDLTISSPDGSASLIMDTVGSLQTPMLTYISACVIGDNHAEDFRFNADALLGNGLTVTKTAVGDSGDDGISILKSGLLWASRSTQVQMILNRQGNDGACAQFGRGKAAVGSISVTASATAYNTSCDERLKHDFQPLDPTLIDAITVYDFAWNHDDSRGYGVKAQELYTIMPSAVFRGDNPETDMWSADYSKLIPLLIAKIQNLEARVAALEAA